MPLLTPHVPCGLIELMKDLAKEVLRDKPENIYEFAVSHFEKLILARDGSMDKGYEQFTAFAAQFDGEQRFAVPSNCGYICQKPIKIQAILQPRKSKSDIMASFQAMESIDEEDVLVPAVPEPAPKPESDTITSGENHYADEKYQNSIYVIQRYFRRYMTRKKKANSSTDSSSGSKGETLSAVAAAIIIQRTMRRLFSNKIKLKKEETASTSTNSTTIATAATVKLVQDDVDNVSEAASYTSSSTIQMLADGQEGRENRLASAQSPTRQHHQQQRDEVSDSEGYGDADAFVEEDNGEGVGDGVDGATTNLTSFEFKEPTEQDEKPTTTSSPLPPPSPSSTVEEEEKVVVTDDDDVDDEKKHSHAIEIEAAKSAEPVETEVDKKSIADENGNAAKPSEDEKKFLTHSASPTSSTDDTSTAQNFGILSTQIGSNYNHQNLSNTKTNTKIDTNARRMPPSATSIQPNPINITKQVVNIIPAGLSVPLNNYQQPSSSSSLSSSLGGTPETLPATSPHLEQTQETFMVHRLQEHGNGHDNGNENDNDKNIDVVASSYFQGKIDDGRMRKFDPTISDGGESLKFFDTFQHHETILFDQDFSDSLNESTMEKDSLEPEELDADSLESNENVVNQHMIEVIVKRDENQDDGSLYDGDKNDGELDADNVPKFIEIERSPTYMYGIHPARTPIAERKVKNKSSEETHKVPDETMNLEVVKSIDGVGSKTPDEKSEEDSMESKGSSSGESSATQIENNLPHRNKIKQKENGEKETILIEGHDIEGRVSSSHQISIQNDTDSKSEQHLTASELEEKSKTTVVEEVKSSSQKEYSTVTIKREIEKFIDAEKGLLSESTESRTSRKEETFTHEEITSSESTTIRSDEKSSKHESRVMISQKEENSSKEQQGEDLDVANEIKTNISSPEQLQSGQPVVNGEDNKDESPKTDPNRTDILQGEKEEDNCDSLKILENSRVTDKREIEKFIDAEKGLLSESTKRRTSRKGETFTHEEITSSESTTIRSDEKSSKHESRLMISHKEEKNNKEQQVEDLDVAKENKTNVSSSEQLQKCEHVIIEGDNKDESPKADPNKRDILESEKEEDKGDSLKTLNDNVLKNSRMTDKREIEKFIDAEKGLLTESTESKTSRKEEIFTHKEITSSESTTIRSDEKSSKHESRVMISQKEENSSKEQQGKDLNVTRENKTIMSNRSPEQLLNIKNVINYEEIKDEPSKPDANKTETLQSEIRAKEEDSLKALNDNVLENSRMTYKSEIEDFIKTENRLLSENHDVKTLKKDDAFIQHEVIASNSVAIHSVEKNSIKESITMISQSEEKISVDHPDENLLVTNTKSSGTSNLEDNEIIMSNKSTEELQNDQEISNDGQIEKSSKTVPNETVSSQSETIVKKEDESHSHKASADYVPENSRANGKGDIEKFIEAEKGAFSVTKKSKTLKKEEEFIQHEMITTNSKVIQSDTNNSKTKSIATISQNEEKKEERSEDQPQINNVLASNNTISAESSLEEKKSIRSKRNSEEFKTDENTTNEGKIKEDYAEADPQKENESSSKTKTDQNEQVLDQHEQEVLSQLEVLQSLNDQHSVLKSEGSQDEEANGVKTDHKIMQNDDTKQPNASDPKVEDFKGDQDSKNSIITVNQTLTDNSSVINKVLESPDEPIEITTGKKDVATDHLKSEDNVSEALVHGQNSKEMKEDNTEDTIDINLKKSTPYEGKGLEVETKNESGVRGSFEKTYISPEGDQREGSNTSQISTHSDIRTKRNASIEDRQNHVLSEEVVDFPELVHEKEKPDDRASTIDDGEAVVKADTIKREEQGPSQEDSSVEFKDNTVDEGQDSENIKKDNVQKEELHTMNSNHGGSSDELSLKAPEPKEEADNPQELPKIIDELQNTKDIKIGTPSDSDKREGQKEKITLGNIEPLPSEASGPESLREALVLFKNKQDDSSEGKNQEKAKEDHSADGAETVGQEDKVEMKGVTKEDISRESHITEEVLDNLNDAPIEMEPTKEFKEDKIISSKTNNKSSKIPLPISKRDDSIQISSPDNGYTESSAETSADFSSIGKDLEFFEDTIKYLKNATEHLGGMDEVFKSKEETDQKPGQDAQLLNRSAVAIQSAFRGYQVRRDLKELNNLEKQNEQHKAQKERAATKIQSVYRGHRVRRNIKDQNILASITKDELPSPSREILGTNAAKSQIPVAVIHPTKYLSSSEEKLGKKAIPANSQPSTSSSQSNRVNTRSSPNKTSTPLKRQKPLEKRSTTVRKSSSDGTIEDVSIRKISSTNSLDKTVLLGNRKQTANGNKTKNLKTKAQSVNENLLARTSTAVNVRDNFNGRGKSLSTNGTKTRSQDSFDLEAIKQQLLSNTLKSPPQSGNKKKQRLRSGKRNSPKKHLKVTKIPQKSPVKQANTKKDIVVSENEDPAARSINKTDGDLSKTFIKEPEDVLASPDTNEAPKKTLSKTYTIRSSLNEVETFNSQQEPLPEKLEHKSEDLFDTLKRDVDKLKTNMQERSAVVIQKTFRGYKARKDLKKKQSDENCKKQMSRSSNISPTALETIDEIAVENDNETVSSSQTKNEEQSSLVQVSSSTNEDQHEKDHNKSDITVNENEIDKLNKAEVVGTEEAHDEKTMQTADSLEKTSQQNEEKSAIVIQKTYRGYKSRKLFNAKKNNERVLKDQAESTSNTHEDFVDVPAFADNNSSTLHRSATTIQKHFRGYKARKDFNAQTSGHRKTKENKEDTSLIENANSTGENENLLQNLVDKSASETGIKPTANKNSAQITRNIREESSSNLDKYATTIQKNFRGYRTRKHFKNETNKKEGTHSGSIKNETDSVQKHGDVDRFNVEEYHKETLEKSATTIQKTFRGYQTRKELRNKKVAEIPADNVQGDKTIEKSSHEEEKIANVELENTAKLEGDLDDHAKHTVAESEENETLAKKDLVKTSNEMHQEPQEEIKDSHNQTISSHSLSAGAVLENAASTIQKAFRNYQSNRNQVPNKSYSNGFHRETTNPKEIHENSDESSTFIGPDTSFDLSDVDSVETRSEKTLNYDKIGSSDTPINSGEEGENTPQKLHLKRNLREPTAPPLDEIHSEEVTADNPKLKWFVGEEPIIPTDSSAASSSVIPLISSSASSSKFDDLSSLDACCDNTTNSNQQLTPSDSNNNNNSAVVSTSSLLLANNTEINDKHSLYSTSEIVSAIKEEKENFKKEENILVEKEGKEENIQQTDKEEGVQSKSEELSGSAEDTQDDNEGLPMDLCKNCAEGRHKRGAVCSGDLIKRTARTDSEKSDEIKQFVLMEEQNISQKTDTSAISSEVVEHKEPNEETKTSTDCPAISLIPPSSEDTDTSERDSSLQEKVKVNDQIKKEVENVGKPKEKSMSVGENMEGNETDITADSASTVEEENPDSEEDKSPAEVKQIQKQEDEEEQNKNKSEDQHEQSKQSSDKSEHDSLEDPFKTRPGDELLVKEQGFEDDFSDVSDSKDIEEPTVKELTSSEVKNQTKQSIEETAKSAEKSLDKVNSEDLIEKFIKLEEETSKAESISKVDDFKENVNETSDHELPKISEEQEVKEEQPVKSSEEEPVNKVDDIKEEVTTNANDKNRNPESPSADKDKLHKENSSADKQAEKQDSQTTDEDHKTTKQEEHEKEQARKLQEDMEIAAKLIENSLSDPQAKLLEKESKTELPISEDRIATTEQSSGAIPEEPESPTQAKLEQLIDDHSKPVEDKGNTVDPEDLPTKNSSQEVVEMPCIKKVVTPPPYSTSSDPEESELESTTTKAESSPTTPGYDETSETDALDPQNSKSDNLLAMTEKLREPEEMVARMQQRRASEHKVSVDSVNDQPAAFEEPICEPIKPMEKIQKSSSTDVEDDLVMHKLQRGDTTRESSAQSESVVFGETATSQSQITESEDTFNENLDMHSLHRMNTINDHRGNFKPPSHLFKSVTIDETVKYIDPEKSTEESGSSFCMDDALSEDVRKKMMAFSVSEADSDGFDIGDHQTSRPHDDFNISTALDTFPSTDTDTTIVSAATKIQAGARGFLTRRRIRRASMGTKTSLNEEKNTSFGNAAIGESLDQLAEEEAGRRQFNRTTGVNSLPSALEHSDEILSPRVADTDQSANKSTVHSIKIENVSSTSSENDVNIDGRHQNPSEDDSFQVATNLEATVARRLTLQRGDALRNDSTPDDENGNGKQVDFAKNTSGMMVHEKTTTTTMTTMTKTTTERRNYSDAAVSSKKDKIKWFALRQNSMPVQIDSEVFRVLPKHMRKRIKSAEGEKPKRIRLPRD